MLRVRISFNCHHWNSCTSGGLRSDCPTGAGSCVTTADVTVTNVGTADAGAFDVTVMFDPAQSVTVTQTVASLTAGASTTLTLTTPAGGNCFDPDCTVCATADSTSAVTESDETNNTDCETVIG